MDVAGALRLVLRDVETSGSDTALVARGVFVDIQDCRFTGPVNGGVGLLLDAVSGSVRRSRVANWATGIRVGDRGGAAYTDLVVGGVPQATNEIVHNLVSLHLDQPEWIDAAYNFWGSVDCALVAAKVVGMEIDLLVSAEGVEAGCPLAARSSTWGAIKRRLAGEP
jgi:hypothetical protein